MREAGCPHSRAGGYTPGHIRTPLPAALELYGRQPQGGVGSPTCWLRAALGGSERQHSQVLETPHDPCTAIQNMQTSVCQRLLAQVSPLGGDARDQGTAA